MSIRIASAPCCRVLRPSMTTFPRSWLCDPHTRRNKNHSDAQPVLDSIGTSCSVCLSSPAKFPCVEPHVAKTTLRDQPRHFASYPRKPAERKIGAKPLFRTVPYRSSLLQILCRAVRNKNARTCKRLYNRNGSAYRRRVTGEKGIELDDDAYNHVAVLGSLTKSTPCDPHCAAASSK